MRVFSLEGGGLTCFETRVRKKYANSLSTFGIIDFRVKISVQKTGKNYVQKIIKLRSLAVKITHKSQILFFKEVQNFNENFQ